MHFPNASLVHVGNVYICWNTHTHTPLIFAAIVVEQYFEAVQLHEIIISSISPIFSIFACRTCCIASLKLLAWGSF